MDQIFIHNPSLFVFRNRFAVQSGRPQLFIDAEALRIAREENNSREAVLATDEKSGIPRLSVSEV